MDAARAEAITQALINKNEAERRLKTLELSGEDRVRMASLYIKSVNSLSVLLALENVKE